MKQPLHQVNKYLNVHYVHVPTVSLLELQGRLQPNLTIFYTNITRTLCTCIAHLFQLSYLFLFV